MPRYAITERAGPFVAGIRNTGVGTVLDLTERQAEHEMRLGTLVRLLESDQSAINITDAEPTVIAATPPDHLGASASQQEAASVTPSRKPKRSTT
jgi:hypothetical protein